MRIPLILTMFAMLSAPAVWAQDDDAPPPERREGLRRPRAGGPGGAGAPGRGLGEAMIQRFKTQLELDEEQAQALDEIAARFREEMRRGGPAGGPEGGPGGPGGGGGAELREMIREIRKAREAGDQTRVDELREQMRNRRQGPRENPRMEAFFDEVRGLLREDQLDRFEEIREQMRRRAREWGPGGGGQRFALEELPEALKLDDAQLQRFEELKQELDAKLAEMRPGPEMREHMRELREAQREGDEARVAELRQLLEKSRPDATPVYDTFFAQLNEELRDEQRPALAEFRKRNARPGGPEGGEIRDLVRAVRRLDLTDEQKDQLKVVTREAMAQERDREGALRPGEVRRKIMEILTPEQAAEVERILSERGEGQRPPRRAPRRPAAPPPPPDRP